MNPTVSVLIPVWRPNPVYFAAALNSLQTQTYQDFEVVIVERESECPSGDTASRILGDRAHGYCLPRDTNIVEQLNFGLDRCRGVFVARFDSDDECDRQRLERQVAHFSVHADVGVLGSSLDLINDDGKTVGCRRYPTKHSDILATFPFANPIAHPAAMFRRDLVAEAGGYRSIALNKARSVPWCQDYELWSRLACRGVFFANIAQPLVRYRVHTGQIKSDHARDVLRATISIKKLHWQGQLAVSARLRMLLERLLIYLPAPLVTRLFLASQHWSSS